MDAPPDHDEGHSSGDALALPSGASSPSLEPATLASQRSNGTEQMAAHRRILALNKVWKDRRTRRSADSIPLYASSSSDTDSDSDSPPAAELPPASEPVPRPSGTPRAASPPGQLPCSLPQTRPGRITDLASDLASDLVVVTNRPVGAPCISRTRVPLPNFLPPLHIASSSHTASRAVAGSGPASSSASSSASSVPAKSVPAKSVPASANIEVARTQALRLTTESALKHLRQTQAYEATSNSQTATSDMHFPTPSELLAKIRQGVAETKRAASSPTPLGLRARGFRRSSNGTDGQDDQGDRGHLPGSDDKSQLVQDKDIILLETLDGRLYTQFPSSYLSIPSKVAGTLC